MAVRPDVSPITEELYAALGPWARRDTESESYRLLELCEAIGQLQQPVEDVARDTDDGPGWSIIVDLDRAPAEWLPFLAQFNGSRAKPGLDAAAQRDLIRHADGIQRGTPSAMRNAPLPYLVTEAAAPYIGFYERIEGSAYRLGVVTLTAETPDPAAVEAAIRAQKPGGIVLEYVVIDGFTFQAVRVSYATFQDVRDAFSTFQDLRDNVPS